MSELYDILLKCADPRGLPIVNRSQFISLTEKYGKEEFRNALAEYVANEKPEYPSRKPDDQKLVKIFHRLKKADYLDYIMNSNREVIEKYDDYKYPYSKYGLGVIDAPIAFNYASDYFMNDLRLSCGSYGFSAPAQVWNSGDAKKIWASIGGLWRNVNTQKNIGITSINETLRLGTYVAGQFKPIVAKTIYEMCGAKTILDTSMGWGDRLTAFYASNATHYIGCDPNPNTFERYKKIIAFYDKLTGGKKTVQMYRCGAEDLPWDKIKNVDCAFTSPPYFSTERYNEGGKHEEDQSWSKYDIYEKWRDDFYLPVAKNSFESLSDNGVLLVNILDPKIKKVRYHSSDELVNSLRDHFIGQIGMRISQRPQGKTVFADEDGNFDKKALDEFMNKIYIENIWCFAKNKEFDLFRHAKRGTLDSFIN